MTGDGAKMVNFGQKMTKHGRNVNVPKWKSSTKSNLLKKKPRPQFSKYCFQNESAWTQPTCPWVTGGRKKSYQVCKMQNAKCKVGVEGPKVTCPHLPVGHWWPAGPLPRITGGSRSLSGAPSIRNPYQGKSLCDVSFLTPHYLVEERAWCCWQMAIYIRGRRSNA